MDTARDFVYKTWAQLDHVAGSVAAGQYGAGSCPALTLDPQPGLDAAGQAWADLDMPQSARAAHCQAPAARAQWGADALEDSNVAAHAPQPSTGRSLAQDAWPGAETASAGWPGQAVGDPDWAQGLAGGMRAQADGGGWGAAQRLQPASHEALPQRLGLEAVDWLLVCNAVLIASIRLKANSYAELAPSLQLLQAMARAWTLQGFIQDVHGCIHPCIQDATAWL